MSRQKKKPTPVSWVEPLVRVDEAARREFVAHIADLWRLSSVRTKPLSVEALYNLAWHCSAYAAQPVDQNKSNRDAAARAALKTLLTWCRYEPNDNGLPHLRDPRRLSLEVALLGALPLMEPTPSRAWVVPAMAIWSRAVHRCKAGKSASSHAVKFTSNVLQWLGYPGATADAISKELRKPESYTSRPKS